MASKRDIAKKSKAPPYKRRSKFYQQASTRKKIVELLAFGYSTGEIAELVGCCADTVRQTAKVFREEIRAHDAATISEMRRVSVDRVDWVAKTAQETFFKSREDAEEITETEGPEGSKVVKSRKKRDGSAEHLNTILAAERRRAELLGLDQPKEVKHYLMERQETLEAILAACEAAELTEAQMEKFLKVLQSKSTAAGANNATAS